MPWTGRGRFPRPAMSRNAGLSSTVRLASFHALPVAVWQWPSLDHLPYLAAIGFFGTFSQRCLARAFHAADASAAERRAGSPP